MEAPRKEVSLGTSADFWIINGPCGGFQQSESIYRPRLSNLSVVDRKRQIDVVPARKSLHAGVAVKQWRGCFVGVRLVVKAPVLADRIGPRCCVHEDDQMVVLTVG